MRLAELLVFNNQTIVIFHTKTFKSRMTPYNIQVKNMYLSTRIHKLSILFSDQIDLTDCQIWFDIQEHSHEYRRTSRDVLFPFLFFLYTADCKWTHDSCLITKFADDTELKGQIPDDDDDCYRQEINQFLEWREKQMTVF